MDIIHHSVFFFSFALLRNGPVLHLSRLAIVAFSRIFSIEKIPVARLSSVRSAKPFLIDSPAFLFFIALPSILMVPDFLVATPNMFSKSSVLPEPSSPATPSISPRRALNETSRSLEYSALSPSTSKSTPSGLFVFGG